MGAWLVLAAGDDRTHGGNDGYDDEPSDHYSWDSTVPNHAAISIGDVIVLWDKKILLGVSVIEDIVKAETEKDTYSCPECGKARFKQRKTMSPAYMCWVCRAEFETPVTRRKPVTTYVSRHDAAWVEMRGVLSGAKLRSLCDSPKSQHSLRPIQWEKLSSAIMATGVATTVTIADTTQKSFHGEQDLKGGHRSVIVRARVGQAAFRERLLATQREVCAFTGPTPQVALEAAHLYSYAAKGRHDSDGGLLLRRDLHRLFDLGLVAVNPETLTLDVSEQLDGYPVYAQLHGTAVTVPLTAGQMRWLRAHWRLHRADSI